MKIVTRQFGEVEFDKKLIINFKDGILGFEQLNRFILLTQENNFFFWLTSIDEPEIVFPLIPVKVLQEDYPEIEGFQSFAIVKLNKEIAKITANLKAPVYINQETNQAMQKIIDDDRFPIDYQVFIEKED